MFGPSSASEPPSAYLGFLAHHLKRAVRNVGFFMDQDLKLDRQIGATVKASFFHLRQLAKVKPFLSPKHLETIIHALVTSRLDFCNALYLGVSQSSLSRLQLVQNAAARLLTGARKREHITPVLASLHWPPVVFRVHFKTLLFVFKSLNGLAPPYLSELLHPYAPARCLRSADQLLLEVPRSKRKLRGERTPSHLASDRRPRCPSLNSPPDPLLFCGIRPSVRLLFRYLHCFTFIVVLCSYSVSCVLCAIQIIQHFFPA